MNLSAYPRTIDDILTLNRKYIVPRFQREYSWEETEHEMFWKDICNQISIKDDEIKFTDYFIGALVLVGDDSKDKEFQIVDGQQRLTTITIIFSVLSKIFIEIGEKSLAQSCYTYVEGKDGDFKPFFKLENENPRPFLQNNIQFVDIDASGSKNQNKPSSIEEEKLLEAHDFYMTKLQQTNLKQIFGDRIDYKNLLKHVRDQILRFKTIFITVNSLDEAYTIFETLNAKGKDLMTIDLIKNKVFKLLDQDHPDDGAKRLWTNFKKELASREKRINPTTFLRHYWLSKYEFTTESQIYESFNNRIEYDKHIYQEFLIDLVSSAKTYNMISNPHVEDWKQMEEKEVYYSLKALEIFNVVQPRSLILALIDAKNRKVLDVNNLRKCIKNIERFHFIFSAVTSSRASGLEGKYSTLSRKLRNSKNKKSAMKVITEIYDYFESKNPEFEVFSAGFSNLIFLNEKTSDKKLIQYIFFNLEKSMYETDEVIPFNLTLEHIFPQSKNSDYKGCIGNLIPLAKAINEKVKDGNLEKKLPEFRSSELKLVQQFITDNEEKTLWKDEDIIERTQKIAEKCYNEVWKIK